MRETSPGYWKGEIWHEGRRKTIVFRGSAAEAKLYEAAQRLEIQKTGVTQSRVAPSFASFCVDNYKPHAKTNLRKATWDNVRRYQVERLILFFGDTKLSEIKEPFIERYKNERIKLVGKVTVNSELTVLSAILKYARETLKVPCAHPKIQHFKTRPKKGRVRFWTLDELQKIYDTCMRLAPSFFPMVLFLGQTGARKSEAVNLPWSRVDFESRIVKIWSDASSADDDDEEEDDYEVKSVEREVPISDALLRVLTEHKAKKLSEEWVFPVRRGDTQGERFVNFPKKSFTRIVKAAGLKGGPHKLRHSYASNFLALKPDLYLLGRLLGHSHERVTQLYAHIVPEYLKEARNVLPVTVPVPEEKPVHNPVHSRRRRPKGEPNSAE